MAFQSTDAYGPANRQLKNYTKLLIETPVFSEITPYTITNARRNVMLLRCHEERAIKKEI